LSARLTNGGFWKTDIFLPKGELAFILQKRDQSRAGARRRTKLTVALMSSRANGRWNGNQLKNLGWRKEQAF
jgi:hypothetical protein